MLPSKTIRPSLQKRNGCFTAQVYIARFLTSFQLQYTERPTVNKVTAAGIAAVARLTEEHRVRGVYGPLIELFQCSEAVATAVEVTAGGSLFHVVVQSDDVASQLIELMHQVLNPLPRETLVRPVLIFCLQEGTSARVTFMPLNRLQVEDVTLPEADNARPLLAQLKYSAMFQDAMKHVRTNQIALYHHTTI